MSAARGVILVVEDSAAMVDLTRAVLGEDGFAAVGVGTAGEALTAFQSVKPVAVLLDWVLPDLPGSELCRQIRAQDPLVPIIFISGRGDEASIARGLDAGADDFLIKPFRDRELISRLEAHIRKATAKAESAQAPSAAAPAVSGFGSVLLDERGREVRVEGQRIALTALEFDLLTYLCRNPGVALSREQILTAVYGYSPDSSTERVDLLVRRLRGKLGADGEQISAIPGYGYKLDRRSLDADEAVGL